MVSRDFVYLESIRMLGGGPGEFKAKNQVAAEFD